MPNKATQDIDTRLALISTTSELAEVLSNSKRQGLSVAMPFSAPITIFESIRITGSRNETSTAYTNFSPQIGDKIQLRCHQKNTMDKWAVEVLYKNERLGWVCADANEVVFRLLEGGKTLGATITSEEFIPSGRIYLMDITLED